MAFACYPLQDPTEGADAIDAALAKQFKAFTSLTKDPVPSVRAQVHIPQGPPPPPPVNRCDTC